ncbi:MAG: response regulator [Verrucomicrobiota bacterium]
MTDEEKTVLNRILLVDDEEQLLDMFKRIISSHFPELLIDTARNGEEAVDQVARHHHGLIVMDMSMPGISGEEAYFRIKKLSSERKWDMPCFVFCTGYDVKRGLKPILNEGSGNVCLRKPMTLTDLVDAIRTQRERQMQQRANG